MTTKRKYKTTTPEAVRDCLICGMSQRRAAEYLGVSPSGLAQAISLFGWRSHGWSGPVRNQVELPVRVNSVFTQVEQQHVE
jgi:hypothetical protein